MAKEDKTPKKKDLKKPKGAIRENLEALVIALILALFIRTFFVQAFKIPTGSMLETLQIGDHILVNKCIYGIKLPFVQKTIIPVKEPEREDIVVFIYPIDKRDFIKRVIGVAGDKIEIKNKKVYVNDKWTGKKSYEKFKTTDSQSRSIPENQFEAIWKDKLSIYKEITPLLGRQYVDNNFKDNFGPITVPEGKIFVMGDNRDNSHDSRFWGFVPLKDVKGKAFIIYWSWDSDAFGVRWNRLGSLLK